MEWGEVGWGGVGWGGVGWGEEGRTIRMLISPGLPSSWVINQLRLGSLCFMDPKSVF